MTTLQTEYTEQELLQSHPVAEPLIAGGVRCHGGFLDDGTYVSPRTANRVPAIRAWRERHRHQVRRHLLALPLATPPAQYPAVAHARLPVQQKVSDRLLATRTL